MKNYQIPFDNRGMQQYPYEYSEGFHWEDNRVFDATLTLGGSCRGRSAAGFVFVDGNGQQYYMFMSDMADLLFNAVLDHGKISGTWTFCKRGMNYGLKLVQAQ